MSSAATSTRLAAATAAAAMEVPSGVLDQNALGVGSRPTCRAAATAAVALEVRIGVLIHEVREDEANAGTTRSQRRRLQRKAGVDRLHQAHGSDSVIDAPVGAYTMHNSGLHSSSVLESGMADCTHSALTHPICCIPRAALAKH